MWRSYSDQSGRGGRTEFLTADIECRHGMAGSVKVCEFEMTSLVCGVGGGYRLYWGLCMYCVQCWE